MKLYQRLTWKFLKLTYGIYIKHIYKIKAIRHKDEPKPPFLLLANHFYFTDAFFIAKFLKYPLHYLGSDEFTSFFQEFLDKSVGLLYIEKGKIDPRAVISMVKLIKNGDSIGIFPEGDGSWDGETMEFSDKIIKLVRMFNVPVVTVKNTGGYLTKPRWAKNFRRGKVTLEFNEIPLDIIKISSDEELFNNIWHKIYTNEIKNPDLAQIEFKGKNLADGIQFLIWKCISCSSHDSIVSDKNDILCTKCGSRWKLSGNMKILPVFENISDLKDWNEWQKKEIKRLCENSGNKDMLTESKDVALEVFEKKVKSVNRHKMVYDKLGKGNILLTKEDLTFISSEGKAEVIFKVAEIKYFVECVNEFFKFYYRDKPYIVKFNGKNSSKYIYFLEELQKDFN